MYEVIFLWALALAWIVFATVQDLRTREIANWLNFSLAIFALGFRFFYSLFNNDGFAFFIQGLIGLGIFFALGNILYYSKMFAGGDAKLLISLGAILPVSNSFLNNIQSFFNFMLLFLLVGSAYTLIMSTILCAKNFNEFKKELRKQFKQKQKLMFLGIFLGLAIMCIGFFQNIFFIFGIIIFLITYLYLYSAAVDESCMIKRISVKKLTVGDWLYSDLKVGKKTIKANWEGVTNANIRELKKKYKTIEIRQGIPFTPTFLISFIIFIILEFLGIELWNSFW